MTTVPPDKPADFTASDILSADAWTGRAPKPVLGIDVVCTKIAVDFQNMRKQDLDETIRRNLELLRDATGADCAFLAPLTPDCADLHRGAHGARCLRPVPPGGARRDEPGVLPLAARRASSTCASRSSATPRARARSRPRKAARFAELHMGSALLVALRVQSKPAGFLGLAHTCRAVPGT